MVAGSLHLGEQVARADGSTAEVVALSVVHGTAPMWDLTVSNVHDFTVGNGAYIVHNCGQGGKPDVSQKVAGEKNLYHGQQRENLRLQGWKRVENRNIVRDNDSAEFKAFVERKNGGAPFDNNKWKYHIETWKSGGRTMENHYWRGSFDHDPFTDVYFHHH